MAGIATVTMLPSRITIRPPVASTPRAIQRDEPGPGDEDGDEDGNEDGDEGEDMAAPMRSTTTAFAQQERP
ncbi:hypothetical protein Acsp03_49320 [Actinomadura sp. NBRC 104412]|nr:hypothetical protein Acsp03_49320 [Actinomadura sp. NBRC 104412]